MENKVKILKENYEEYVKACPVAAVSFPEWVELESESDPGFFRWLYNDWNLGDFDCPNRKEFNNFINNL